MAVVGVRFAKAGKISYYNPGGEQLEINDYVVVKGEDGLRVGYVVIAPDQVVMAKFKGPLAPIVRKATPDDLQTRDRLQRISLEVMGKFKEIAGQMRLEVKPVEAIFSLDADRVTVSYLSEEKIDIRELQRRLGEGARAQVLMREVGPRDETKVLGGLGRCGRELCCSTWLTEFQPVSMKMAKEQDLPLSPPGLAGVCGRLRCCLRYEYETYRELKKGLPKIGAHVQTVHGEATVVVGHPLKQTVTVRIESGAWVEVPMTELDGSAQPAPVTVMAVAPGVPAARPSGPGVPNQSGSGPADGQQRRDRGDRGPRDRR